MTQSYAVVLSVSFALIAAGFRPTASFGIHEEESHREPPPERSPPFGFPGSRDRGRPHDDQHSPPPPPPPPKSDHHSERHEDREDADDDGDDLRSEHHPSFRKYGHAGSDPRRMEGEERDRNENDLRRYDSRDDEGRLPRTPFHRLLDVRQPSGGEEDRRRDDDSEDWWKTDEPDSRGIKDFPDKKRAFLDDLEGEEFSEPPEKEINGSDEDELWARPPNVNRNRKHDSSRHGSPSISDRRPAQPKLHYLATSRTSSSKTRPGWRAKIDFNSFNDKKKRA